MKKKFRKDATVSDTHVPSALGGEKPKARSFKDVIGERAKIIAEKKDDPLDWSIPFTIAKADADQQLIFGWASIVEKDGALIIDKQGDAILPVDLEKAAYDFVLTARNHGDMHDTIGTGRLVESMVFTKDKQAALGIDLGKVGWWTGFKVDSPEVWAAHKRGDRPDFSIGGSGVREEI